MTWECGAIDRRSFLSHCSAGLATTVLSSRVLAETRAVSEAEAGGAEERDSASRKRTIDGPWREVRAQFPLDPGLSYFNTGGLGPSPYPVLETVNRHTLALERISEPGHELVAQVRRGACEFLHCEEDELAITRNTTEGMNTVARGLPFRPGDEVLLTTHEHPGGAMPWFALARDSGIVVRTFEPGSGGDDTLERVRASVTPRTRVVSVSHITCTTGMVLPVRQIAALCRDRGVLSVIDGAQAVGMIPVDVHDLGCDFYATSGHKWLLGPKGTGLLYVRREMLDVWRATFVGAYSDEEFHLDRGIFRPLAAARAVEYGTRNTALILGLGAAIDFIRDLGIERIARRGRELCAYLTKRLEALQEVAILTPTDAAASGSIVTFRVPRPDFEPWEWANELKETHRIRVRPVGEHGLNALRVSTHMFNTFDDIDRLVAALGKMISA